jgi:MFS transporter, FSR family, fosmidomycin resistance protein
MKGRGVRTAVIALLAVEVLDELVFGAREAAWPLIRDDLDLSYAQVGLLVGVPAALGTLLEPPLGLLGDAWRRDRIVALGGVVFAAGLLLLAAAPSFWVLMVAFALLFPASGGFVSLSQATLMDADPGRREQNMTRWSVAGGVGAVSGPLALSVFVLADLGWRGLFAVFAVVAIPLIPLVARPSPARSADRFRAGDVLRLLRRREVLRWLVLLETVDLMLDGLLAFLALYIVDEAGGSAAGGAFAVAVWTGAGLVGGLGLIGLLRRVSGLAYLRSSALVAAPVFAAFLLVDALPVKIGLVGLLGLVTAGWYSIPKARLYAALPGRSGTAVAFGSLFGAARGAVPIVLGAVAARYGLDTALWLLLAAPASLLLLAPRGR